MAVTAGNNSPATDPGNTSISVSRPTGTAMRENQHFHPAVVEIEKLQHELKTRHGVGLPVPEEVWQRPEPSIIIAWGKLSVIAFEGGIGGLVGGTAGSLKRGISDELLAALALRAKMQPRS